MINELWQNNISIDFSLPHFQWNSFSMALETHSIIVYLAHVLKLTWLPLLNTSPEKCNRRPVSLAMACTSTSTALFLPLPKQLSVMKLKLLIPYTQLTSVLIYGHLWEPSAFLVPVISRFPTSREAWPTLPRHIQVPRDHLNQSKERVHSIIKG